jgi:hypothetical protein
MKALILGAGSLPIDPDVTPLWLLEHDGMLLVERFVHACAAIDAELVFAVRAQEMKRWRIDSVIALAAPGAALVPITGDTAGAACTALLCVQHIDPDAELLILNSNEYIDIDYAAPIQDFRARGLDAGAIVFPSIHPRYSYVRLDTEGLIIEAAEKNPISRHATPGFTWFRRGADFITAAQDMIRKDANVDGRYFISLTLNEMVLRQKRMGVFEIDAKRYHPLKSPRQRSSFEAEGPFTP